MSRFDYFCLGYVMLLLFFGFRDEPEGGLPNHGSSQDKVIIAQKVSNPKAKVSEDMQRMPDQIRWGVANALIRSAQNHFSAQVIDSAQVALSMFVQNLQKPVSH